MPAKNPLLSSIAKKLRAKKPLFVLVLAAVVGLAAWVGTAWDASATPVTESAITPAIKLAVGTIKLENTDQAVDKASAAKLLPLWQLLAQLQDSPSAAPQEITSVTDEIKLNMTESQIKAIDAMAFSEAELGSAQARTGSTGASSTQAVSPAMDPMLSGGMAGGAPLDGGGPMPGAGTRSTSSSKSTTSASASAVSSPIQQVIQLLQAKVQT